MPLHQCSDNGQSGWKWGNSGKCYTGPDGKKKAIKQGYAEDPKHFKEEISKSKEIQRVISNEFPLEEQVIFFMP